MNTSAHIVIIGAGPTGLGAAWRLQELGHTNWLLLESANSPGGLASSVIDPQGFTWDIGGHVVFSHYDYFDHLLDELLGQAWVRHIRESWIWMRRRFIPYPMQNNLWRLPAEDLARCLEGLRQVQGPSPAQPPPENFRQWILQHFGRGLADVFMLPYNFKVWAYDPAKLGVGWMGERVAPVDLQRVLNNVEHQRDDVSWGPNATFRFPLHGGTGAIWRALAARLPSERLRFNTTVIAIDTARKQLRCADGSRCEYDHLISTMPLDLLLTRLVDREGSPIRGTRRLGAPDLHPLAGRYLKEGDPVGQPLSASCFLHSSTHIVGIGVDGPLSEALKTKCWMYFPEPDTPFYRVTVFSNYSPNNVPQPGRQCSFMCEVSESPDKPVDQARVVEQVEEGLRRAELLPERAAVISRWHCRLEHGYPTPFLGRDALLEQIDPQLRALGIYSRGRFGAWKYEVSNQDHSTMQGVEAVNHLLRGEEEVTYHRPEQVNRAGQPKAR